MLKRYMVLEGLPGVLVTSPVSDSFVGQMRKNFPDGHAPSTRAEHFTPIKTVLEWHPHLSKAVANGTLKQHGATVLAEDPDKALAMVSAPTPKKPAQA